METKILRRSCQLRNPAITTTQPELAIEQLSQKEVEDILKDLKTLEDRTEKVVEKANEVMRRNYGAIGDIKHQTLMVLIASTATRFLSGVAGGLVGGILDKAPQALIESGMLLSAVEFGGSLTYVSVKCHRRICKNDLMIIIKKHLNRNPFLTTCQDEYLIKKLATLCYRLKYKIPNWFSFKQISSSPYGDKYKVITKLHSDETVVTYAIGQLCKYLILEEHNGNKMGGNNTVYALNSMRAELKKLPESYNLFDYNLIHFNHQKITFSAPIREQQSRFLNQRKEISR